MLPEGPRSLDSREWLAQSLHAGGPRGQLGSAWLSSHSSLLLRTGPQTPSRSGEAGAPVRLKSYLGSDSSRRACRGWFRNTLPIADSWVALGIPCLLCAAFSCKITTPHKTG